MKTASDFLTPADVGGGLIGKIAAVQIEQVDGRPRVVLYFKGQKKGMVLCREDIDALTAAYGPSPVVEEWKRTGQADQ